MLDCGGRPIVCRVGLEDALGYCRMRYLGNGVLTEDFCGYMEYVCIVFQSYTSPRLTNYSAGSGKSTLLLVSIGLYSGDTKSLTAF